MIESIRGVATLADLLGNLRCREPARGTVALRKFTEEALERGFVGITMVTGSGRAHQAFLQPHTPQAADACSVTHPTRTIDDTGARR